MTREADRDSLSPHERAQRGGLLRFAHHAMACDWTFALHCDDARYARQAVAAAAAEIDRLESELSRFVATSDISRLNATPPGVPLLVGADALAVLSGAEEIRIATRGAFDVSVGARVPRDGMIGGAETENIAEADGGDDQSASPQDWLPAPRVVLDRVGRTAARADAEVLVDLGAIGKGFAVDAAVEVLREWKIPGGLVTSGQSSVFAFGAPPEPGEWRVALRDPRDHARMLAQLALQDAALSGSGIALHGRHIIDPRTGRPANGPDGAWAVAPSGALSDAVSTALMVLSGAAAQRCLEQLPEVAGFVFEPQDGGRVIALTANAGSLFR